MAFSFGIVISPRVPGIKALAVCLTKSAKAHLDFLRQDAVAKKLDVGVHTRSNLLRDTKYYYQVPFEASPELCTVVDFRTPNEMVSQLSRFIVNDKADTCWN